jgi:hypothetical protein
MELIKRGGQAARGWQAQWNRFPADLQNKQIQSKVCTPIRDSSVSLASGCLAELRRAQRLGSRPLEDGSPANDKDRGIGRCG